MSECVEGREALTNRDGRVGFIALSLTLRSRKQLRYGHVRLALEQISKSPIRLFHVPLRWMIGMRSSMELRTLLLFVWSLCSRAVAIVSAAAYARAHLTQSRPESERCDEAYPALTMKKVVVRFYIQWYYRPASLSERAYVRFVIPSSSCGFRCAIPP